MIIKNIPYPLIKMQAPTKCTEQAQNSNTAGSPLADSYPPTQAIFLQSLPFGCTTFIYLPDLKEMLKLCILAWREQGERNPVHCVKKVHYHMPEGLHDFTFIVYRKAASLLIGFMDQEQGRKKCTPTQFSHQILLRFHCKNVTAHTQHNHPC